MRKIMSGGREDDSESEEDGESGDDDIGNDRFIGKDKVTYWRKNKPTSRKRGKDCNIVYLCIHFHFLSNV